MRNDPDKKGNNLYLIKSSILESLCGLICFKTIQIYTVFPVPVKNIINIYIINIYYIIH